MKIKVEQRTTLTLDGFPEIVVISMPGQAQDVETPTTDQGPAIPPHASERAPTIQKAAKRASAPYLLVYPAGMLPTQEWLQAAQNLFDDSPSLACITNSDAGEGPIPTLWLNPAAMMIRCHILIESRGLSRIYQGIGDGPDLAWRLWFMGYRVFCLPTGTPVPLSPYSPPLYLGYRNWLWTLIRNCEEASLGTVLSRALLHVMAWTGKLAENTAVTHVPDTSQSDQEAYIEKKPRLRDRATDLGNPIHRVSPQVGETLALFHDTVSLLSEAFKERKSIQKLRRRSDGEIELELGQTPTRAIQEYFTTLSQGSLQIPIEDKA